MGVPLLKEVRVGQAHIRGYPEVKETPAGLRPSERDEVLIHTAAGMKRDAGSKATERTFEVEVIYRAGRHWSHQIEVKGRSLTIGDENSLLPFPHPPPLLALSLNREEQSSPGPCGAPLSQCR